MEVFWLLALGHFLGDFTFQTNYIAAWKRRNVWGLFTHASIHLLLCVILCWPYLNNIWIDTPAIKLNGWSCILLAYILHIFEDEWRIWSVTKRGAPDNTIFYLWDQVIHFVALLAISPVTDIGFIGPKWPIIGCLLVLPTHFATVTIFFLEKDIFKREFPQTDEKYITMVERLGVTGCFFLPGYMWLLFVPLIAGRFFWHKIKRRFDYTWTNLVVGNTIAITCGIIIKFLVLPA